MAHEIASGYFRRLFYRVFELTTQEKNYCKISRYGFWNWLYIMFYSVPAIIFTALFSCYVSVVMPWPDEVKMYLSFFPNISIMELLALAPAYMMVVCNVMLFAVILSPAYGEEWTYDVEEAGEQVHVTQRITLFGWPIFTETHHILGNIQPEVRQEYACNNYSFLAVDPGIVENSLVFVDSEGKSICAIDSLSPDESLWLKDLLTGLQA